MDGSDEQGWSDELSAAESSRARWAAGAVAAVLLVAGITVAHAVHHSAHRHPAATPPVSAPAPVAATRRVHLGSVFLEHLPDCTATDHRHRLTVAVAVTNLGDQSLRLIGASGLTSNPFVVRPTTLSFGGPPCGGKQIQQHVVRIASGKDVIVRVHFYVADKCPGAALVSARMTFDGGRHGVIHADSSELANLAQLDFAQCA